MVARRHRHVAGVILFGFRLLRLKEYIKDYITSTPPISMIAIQSIYYHKGLNQTRIISQVRHRAALVFYSLGAWAV